MNKISLIIICLFVQSLSGCTGAFEGLPWTQSSRQYKNAQEEWNRLQALRKDHIVWTEEDRQAAAVEEEAKKQQLIIQASRIRVLDGVAMDVVEYDKILAEACDKLEIRLCGDLGTETYMCKRMRDRTGNPPRNPAVCKMSLENQHYPKLLEELKNIEREKEAKEKLAQELAKEQEECSKNKQCVIDQENKSYVDKICDPIIGIYENRAIIAQENSNPSGVRDLSVLYESGKAIQQYQLERREANIEFRNRYHRAFPESICKQYAESDE
jgi:hypothetical protein